MWITCLWFRDQRQLESVYCSEERAYRRIIEVMSGVSTVHTSPYWLNSSNNKEVGIESSQCDFQYVKRGLNHTNLKSLVLRRVLLESKDDHLVAPHFRLACGNYTWFLNKQSWTVWKHLLKVPWELFSVWGTDVTCVKIYDFWRCRK